MTSPTFVDETGNTHGRLLVVNRAENKTGKAMWDCRCTCGKKTIVAGAHLRSGRIVSCGCRQAEVRREQVYTEAARAKHKAWLDAQGGREKITTHGHSAGHKVTSIYKAWRGMKSRCLNLNSKDFPEYGGRGIIICEEWINSFETFLADMGEKPSPELSLDRIDNDGPYSPENCRWVSKSVQSSNQRKRRVRRKASHPYAV